jgi:restriction system protein
MARKNKQSGPQFLRFFNPVLEALQGLGGSGRPSEVVDWIASNLNVPEEEQSEQLASGQSRFANEIHWARFYLAKTGYIDSSKRGVWSLTEKGLSVNKLSQQDIRSIFQEVQNDSKKGEENNPVIDDKEAPKDLPVEKQTDYRSELMSTLQSLPPDGFERLCQRLLRESGFQQVNVTGRTGDGGIDGNGLLEVNPFVSFRVLFQCKRYTGSVTVSQVRDFRGAMMGRADKGIILTTGTFTSDAKQEAVRDGVPPIELVNGEKLLDLLQQLELGLKPVTSYEVDNDFFDEFRK